nr:HAD domain-containing protein [Rhodoferax sp.]
MKGADLADQSTDQLILFLDSDGVLHPDGVGTDLEFCQLDNFEGVMREFPQVRIVVSSTWRLSESVEELRRHFSADIQERIVGVTPRVGNHDSVRGQRQRECEAWIRENSPDVPWLALDDWARYFDEGCENLVLIPHVYDGGAGLEGEYVEGLRMRIGEMLGSMATDPAAHS